MTDLERFTTAFIEALYFTDTGGEGQPPSDAEIHPETLEDLKADCRSFWWRYGYLVPQTDQAPEQAGHDFWLTRNGHGAGLWEECDWPHPYGPLLDKGAKGMGPVDLYYDEDDGMIHAYI